MSDDHRVLKDHFVLYLDFLGVSDASTSCDEGQASAFPSNYTMEKSSEQTRHCCSISLNRRIRGSSRTSGMLAISS